jgi:suppressor for copper-sensitivity B
MEAGMVRLFAAIFILLAAFQQASAGDGLRVSLVSGGFGKSGATALFGLKVDMDPGWHAYWRSPGETGLPPDLKVSAASGTAKIFWPLPERFSASGFETVGYRQSFIIPIVASGVDAGVGTELTVSGTLYACSDICVPFPVSASAAAAAGSGDGAATREIARWLARSPGGADRAGVELQSVIRDGADLVATFTSREQMAAPQAFLDMGMEAFGSLKSLDVDTTGRTATARFGIANLRQAPPDLAKARIVISDGRSAPIDTPFDLQHEAATGILLVALLGGFILNAMPCVFPVLAIKLFLLVSTDGARLRRSLFAMSAGVVATFLIIGLALAAAKGAGHAVGWGMQFQQPVFLAAMAVLLCGFGASMSGAFEILLPSSVATKVSGATDGSGVWKSFLQGMVLTLLATPCSAPFVGTAVGYGLSSGGYADVLSVFAAMGLGMSAPFLLLAIYPKAISLLPRPGRGMESVKHATAVAMFATAGWLLFLVYSTGSNSALAVSLVAAAAALVATAVASWRMSAAQVVALLLAPTLFLAPDLTSSGIRWQKFEPDRIDTLVSQGQTVFVDISADWCLTCKVNERGVLATEETRAVLQKTVPMKGDWTRPDDEIARYLKAHGRYGIPFYLVVGPGAPAGILLPELLTEDAVRRAVERAAH